MNAPGLAATPREVEAPGWRVRGNRTPPKFHGIFANTRLESRPSCQPHREVSMVQQWIDVCAGLAYISVGVQLETFQEFLDAIEKLISRQQWRPGMPVVEDLRECRWIPPASAIADWRAYVADHHRLLRGCRWAAVTREESLSVRRLLDAAAKEVVPYGVLLKQFTNIVDAHLWAKVRTLA